MPAWPSSRPRKPAGRPLRRPVLRPSPRPGSAPSSRFARPAPRSNRTWSRRARILAVRVRASGHGYHPHHPQAGRHGSRSGRPIMKNSIYRRLGFVLLFVCLSAGVIAAQDSRRPRSRNPLTRRPSRSRPSPSIRIRQLAKSCPTPPMKPLTPKRARGTTRTRSSSIRPWWRSSAG